MALCFGCHHLYLAILSMLLFLPLSDSLLIDPLSLFCPSTLLAGWADGPSRGGAEEQARRGAPAAGERRRPVGCGQGEAGSFAVCCVHCSPLFGLCVSILSSRGVLFVYSFLRWPLSWYLTRPISPISLPSFSIGSHSRSIHLLTHRVLFLSHLSIFMFCCWREYICLTVFTRRVTVRWVWQPRTATGTWWPRCWREEQT